MKRLLILTVLSSSLTLTPAALLVGGAAAQAAPDRCQGMEATIVGSGQRTITGTAGDDVIITNGSDVAALAGDDLICVTARPGRKDTATEVKAGSGDDRVVVKTGKLGRDLGNTISLGDGDDVLIGGDGEDRVDLAGGDGHDVLRTGGGRDYVTLPFKPLLIDDEIYLQGGGGNVSGRAVGMTDAGVLDGGDGSSLSLDVGAGDWEVDNRTGQASRGGETRFTWTDFDYFYWTGDGVVSFQGSGRDETFFGSVTSASMGGGDDVLVANSTRIAAGAPAELRGGQGRDQVSVERKLGGAGKAKDLVLDVPAQEARTGAGQVVAELSTFEVYEANSNRGAVTVLGTGGDDVLAGQGCGLTIRGGRGDDRITSARMSGSYRCGFYEKPGLLAAGSGDDVVAGASSPMLVEAGAGDDVVRGSTKDDVLHGQRGDDVLIGGRRKDVAYGGQGRDRCVAERRVACER